MIVCGNCQVLYSCFTGNKAVLCVAAGACLRTGHIPSGELPEGAHRGRQGECSVTMLQEPIINTLYSRSYAEQLLLDND